MEPEKTVEPNGQTRRDRSSSGDCAGNCSGGCSDNGPGTSFGTTSVRQISSGQALSHPISGQASGGHISVCPVQDRDKWDAYVLSHPHGGPYHQYAWMEAVRKAYGYTSLPLGLWRNGALAGVLPVVRHVVPSRTPVLTSLPFCDYGGALANSPDDAQALHTHLQEYAVEHGMAVELRRPVHPVDDSSLAVAPLSGSSEAPASGASPTYSESVAAKESALPHKVLMRLPLPESSEVLWKSFKSKLRNQVLRPTRGGLQDGLGGLELLDDFYTVYARNMRDLGSPPHAKHWFKAVLEEYGERARLFTVRHSDGTCVGASLLLLHNHIGTVPWASTLRSWNKLSPNMLLYWKMLEFCADSECREFDFGRSTPQEGTYRFKAQWGAAPVPLLWEHVSPQGQYERLESGPPSAARQFVVRCWQKLPVGVSNLAGSILRRYISL